MSVTQRMANDPSLPPWTDEPIAVAQKLARILAGLRITEPARELALARRPGALASLPKGSIRYQGNSGGDDNCKLNHLHHRLWLEVPSG
jgi:hypothetical protein